MVDMVLPRADAGPFGTPPLQFPKHIGFRTPRAEVPAPSALVGLVVVVGRPACDLPTSVNVVGIGLAELEALPRELGGVMQAAGRLH